MDFEQTVRALPGPVLSEFERALRDGHWGCGLPLTQLQRRICRRALQLRLECEYSETERRATVH